MSGSDVRLVQRQKTDKIQDKDSPFHTGINNKLTGNSWKVSHTLGKNTLRNIIKIICEEAGIQGRKVNEDRYYNVLHAGIPTILLQQHHGHKYLFSIRITITVFYQSTKRHV